MNIRKLLPAFIPESPSVAWQGLLAFALIVAGVVMLWGIPVGLLVAGGLILADKVV